MKKLRKLGKVKHVSRSGMIVVAVNPEKLPKVGSNVVTRKMEQVGWIQDIIGPVSSPYALIKPSRLDLADIVLDDLFVVCEYAGSGESKGKRSRKGSRKKGNRKRGGH
jgi:RNA-binding protein